MFSGQKGASAEDKIVLENGMRKAAKMLGKLKGINIESMEGAGAAGGISGGFVAALGATLKKGIRFVSEAYHLEEEIKQSDLILTGEGSFDRTSLEGKVPHEVLQVQT